MLLLCLLGGEIKNPAFSGVGGKGVRRAKSGAS